MEVCYMTQNVEMPRIDANKVNSWIEAVARKHDRRVGTLTYVFCDDEYILATNKQFLQHDYYTDIITFDYSEDDVISGDIFISLDTVRTNAEQFATQSERFKSPYEQELHRVIIHGVLHLCGINDKGPGEREIMEQNENEALGLL